MIQEKKENEKKDYIQKNRIQGKKKIVHSATNPGSKE